MASSPVYRATPEVPRYRSSNSVPVQSRAISRSETPGSNRESKSFFNRQVTPSVSRPQSSARLDVAALINHKQRIASAGKLLETYIGIGRKHKDRWLEDDDEVDLMTEQVYRPDGTIVPLCPDQGQSSPHWSTDEEDSPEAGPSRERIFRQRSQDADNDNDPDDDSYDTDEDIEAAESEDEDDELGSWKDQEQEIKEQLAHRRDALLLASLAEQTSDDELEKFLRDEEEARARRMSARAEGRDSRCHTDKLSQSDQSEESEVEKPQVEYRSPSQFSTIVTDALEDLFADDESGEDELALLPSSSGDKERACSSGESGSEDELQRRSAAILAKARQVRSTWQEGESSSRQMTYPLSPDTSPEPEIIAEEIVPILSKTSASHQAKQPSAKASKRPGVTTVIPFARKIGKREAAINDKPQSEVQSARRKKEKGKSRMAGERPAEPAVLDDVFGPGDTIDVHTLDRQRYRRNRYRQKASTAYKSCRYCRIAEPARAKLAEYCRGANHSKMCTFKFPPKSVVRDNDADTDDDKPMTTTHNTFWKHRIQQVPAIASKTTTPASGRRSGLTSIGLEKWRYFENLVKRTDKQTDRSCPYCRASDDATRLENAVYCRGRIESRDCTFDGHKGSLRISSKKKQLPKEVQKEEPTHPKPLPPILSIKLNTPKSPSLVTSAPDLTVDESKLDIKLYYTSLIQSQLQNGYRFCPDCARSGEHERERLSYWCRGRISYKACGYWDGNNSGHRQPRRSISASKVESARKSRVIDPTKSETASDNINGVSTLTTNNTVPTPDNQAVDAMPPRKRGRPRKSDGQIHVDAETTAYTANDLTIPTSKSKSPDSEPRSQAQPIKRKPGRPRKTPLLETRQTPTSKPEQVASHEDETKKRESGESRTQRIDPDVFDNVDAETVHVQETIDIPVGTPKVWPGSGTRTSSDEPSSRSRRKRSRTFDIVVPVSRSSTPIASSPTLEITGGQDRSYHIPSIPVSAMRNTHVSSQRPTHGLVSDSGIRELDSLPPSSPPASLSPSPSPRPIRYMASGHRSSPLASLRQQDRSSSALSETRSPCMPIRGILRQSSEASDAPRKRARVSFSLIRSPSPVEESEDGNYDSDSSDDVLLLVGPSSESRRSAPPSSRRNGSSSPFGTEARFAESPQAGRLSSSTLAAYAQPLDTRTLNLGSASGTIYTPPQAPRGHTGQRSPLSTPPITSRSVPPPSNRGLMLPPPAPKYKSAAIPQTEPRLRGNTKRPRNAEPIPRPRSLSVSYKLGLPEQRLVAEHKVVRQLINNS